MSKLHVLDLFSGIGGFSLGLERTGGFETVAFCEIEPYCRAVLAKHWPDVPCYDDVRELAGVRLAADGISVDVICGGFPCQDISVAGKGAGLAGERSGLWREYSRIIGELRPRLVFVENVAALLGRGLGVVLGDLAALGYDAEWHCIPAAAVGAPHRRDRVWIIANADRGRQRRSKSSNEEFGPAVQDGWQARGHSGARGGDDVADAYNLAGHQGRPSDATKEPRGRDAYRSCFSQNAVCDADRQSLAVGQSFRSYDVEKFAATVGADWWAVEPDVGRVAHGVSARVDRLRGIGNAVVPQIPELIGKAILESMREAA